MHSALPAALRRQRPPPYDERFAAARGYVYRDEMGRRPMRAEFHGRILDVGAGTGLVGAALAGCGAPVEALDISPEMLAQANGVHDRLVEADIT